MMEFYEERKRDARDNLLKAHTLLQEMLTAPGKVGLGKIMGLITIARISVESYWHPEWKIDDGEITGASAPC